MVTIIINHYNQFDDYVVLCVKKYWPVYSPRCLHRVGFRWHLRAPWEHLPTTPVGGACPHWTPQHHHHRQTWLKCHRCSKAYTPISLSPCSSWPINSPFSSSRFHSPRCRLPHRPSPFSRRNPSPRCPIQRPKANLFFLPNYPHRRYLWLCLCCLAVAALHTQIALLILGGHFVLPPPLPLFPPLLLYPPVPKFTQIPPPLLSLWDRNKNLNMRWMWWCQRGKRNSRSRTDPFGVSLLCVAVMNIWILLLLWMRCVMYYLHVPHVLLNLLFFKSTSDLPKQDKMLFLLKLSMLAKKGVSFLKCN